MDLTFSTDITIMVTTVVIHLKQISTRFSIAVHILSLIAVSSNDCTGDFIASSVNTNPVIIRRIMGMLKKAGLLEVRAGVGGASLLKSPEQITLLDVYRAVNVTEENQLFRIHEAPNYQCPVGRNIELVLQSELKEAQSAMEQRLAQTTLSQLTARFK
jgi:DNA-binding IscR family transcriptional regulator